MWKCCAGMAILIKVISDFSEFNTTFKSSKCSHIIVCTKSNKNQHHGNPRYMAFFHPLPYFRHSVTNWFCSRQIHDSHTHMLSQFIPAWMLLQSILREEEHKKMASNAVSIKGCSYSSMIHWFVGKRVNLFSASLIIDLRRFFVKMKDLKFLLYFLANGFSPKLRKINK